LRPASIALEQSVCGDDELSHDGGDGDLGGFSGSDELLRCPMLVIRVQNPGIRSGLMEKKGAILL